MKYASVIVNISHENLDKVYDYAIPKEWEAQAQIGAQVLIPFGKGNREIKGFILALSDQSQFDPEKVKSIREVITEGFQLEGHLIRLAVWIREQYGGTMNDALRTVLPVKRKVKEKQTKYLHLQVGRDRLSRFMEECERKHWNARLRLAQALMDCDPLEYTQARNTYQVTADAVKKLQELGIIRVSSQKTYRNPVAEHVCEVNPVVLTPVQQTIVNDICGHYAKGDYKPSLIYGVTGSGKTEVYMALMEYVLAQGKQAIFLIPEIALTYPMVERFYQRFEDRISVLHSKLSEGERSDQYQRAQNGEIDIMIGPRSAVFTPFKNLGMIVIDEEQEPGFQNEGQPKYHTREVAIARASMCDAAVVLGSATPSLESFYQAKKGAYYLYEMKERIGVSRLPSVQIVDMREEFKQRNRSIFSQPLSQGMEEALAQGRQILLFINRRGYAGFVSCRSCGYVAKCPHCDVSLTAHQNGSLHCHYCGYQQPAFKNCPSCGSPYIATFGIGTQKVEEYTKKEFPNAKVLRMDRDTTGRKGDYEKILAQFDSGQADILIGTQMIAKGHDFANVSLVGAVAADLSLHFNDYRSAERTFQLLSQAGGRAGRRESPGQLIVQTYQPEHYAMEMIGRQDYEGFYEQEIAYREVMQYPPAGHMLAILVTSLRLEKLERAVSLLHKTIKQQLQGQPTVLIGPTDATVNKIQDRYRKVLYLKDLQKERLIRIKDLLSGSIRESADFSQVNIYYDFDPMTGY